MQKYKFSFFSGNIKNLEPDRVIDHDELYNLIKYGEFKQLQLEVAREQDKVKRRELKAKILPYITISGVFQKRSNTNLLAHSGLIAIDFDDPDNFDQVRTSITSDPYTFMAFNSVSGLGICVIVKINPDPAKHLAHFNWLSKYYYDNYGLVIDSSCKDVSRARFVSYDPDIFINTKSKRAGVKQEIKPPKKRVQFIPTESQMDRIVSDICTRGINITESYEEYLNVGLSIASEYREGGRQYFHAVSSMSSKYNEKECNKKYDNLIKSSHGKRTIASFFYMAKQAGVELFTANEKKAQDIAKAARKSQSTPESAVETAVTIHGIDKVQAQEAARAVFDSPAPMYEPDEDTPVIEQLTNFLDINHTFKKNKYTRVIHSGKREVDDQFVNTQYIKCKALIGNKVTKSDIEAIINSDRTQEIDPFKEFYEKNSSLPSDPDVIERFCDTITSDTPDYRYWLKKWLYGLPAACNGEIVRIVLVLCGGQNTGKTTWFRWILPPSLRNYYAESRLDRGKDDELAMTQNLIIMDDEFGGKTRKDVEKFKELISKESFYLREPYGKRNIHIKRLALLGGTSNPTEVINDPTGNTRIIPINVLDINHPLTESIDRKQLFVELWRAWENGSTWRLSKEDVEKFEQFNDLHEEIQFERELIDKFFYQDLENGEFMTTTDVKNYIETHSVQRILSIRKFGIELKKIFMMKKIRGNRGYYLVKKNGGHLTSSPQNQDELPY